MLGCLLDKPTCSQSSRGLVNSMTSQLTDSEFLNNGNIIIYLYTEQKLNTNPYPTDY